MADISQFNINNTIYNCKDTEGRTQVEIMPTASADLLGKIYQFVGTTGVYTNGFFYKCVPGATSGTYEWTTVAVQEDGGSAVQSDWNQTDNAADDYIKNKPDLFNVIEQTGTLPEPSREYWKKMYLYMGSSASGFQYAHLYKCLMVAMSPPSYYWSDITDDNWIQPDWNQTNSFNADYIKNKPTLGTAAAKDSTNAVTANSTDLVESGAVKTAIDAAVSSAYHHAGTSTVAGLTASLLVAANEGNVYNITDSGVTTANFIEGAGKVINAGDNVGIAKIAANTYKFDLLSGFVDISGKADKVSGATAGHFAALDSNGNLTDSGKTATDFATAADVTGEDISATSTTSPLTDSADGYVQGVTVKGHSKKTKNLINISNGSKESAGYIFWNLAVNLQVGSYTLSGTLSVSNPSFALIQNGTAIINATITLPYTFTISENDTYQLSLYVGESFTWSNIQLEEGSTATPYEPYFSGIKSIGDACWGVVDLGTLTYTRYTPENGTPYFKASISGMYSETEKLNEDLYCPVYQLPAQPISARNLINLQIMRYETNIYIRNDTYTDATDFKSAMSGVLLYYPLADTTGATPTFGITSKNGEGQGTTATITTGLPLRSVSDSIYDTLDNEKVVKNCAEVDLGTMDWVYNTTTVGKPPMFIANIANTIDNSLGLCSKYNCVTYSYLNANNEICIVANSLRVCDDAYTDATAFKTAVTGVKLVYPLATPTETPLTSAEKSALAQLRTYDSTTYIDATDAPTMTVNYLLNTNNGQAVAGIQKDLQEQIDDKITISPQLTLTVAGWDSTTLQQTVTFAHDISKRNVIDITLLELEDWAACGVVAIGETASVIAFKCEEIPESALTFTVCSMSVN